MPPAEPAYAHGSMSKRVSEHPLKGTDVDDVITVRMDIRVTSKDKSSESEMLSVGWDILDMEVTEASNFQEAARRAQSEIRVVTRTSPAPG